LFSRLVAVASAAMLMSACAVSNLNLVNDHRLQFLSPPSRAHLHLPVKLSWTIRDFTATPPGTGAVSRDHGYFAIFVDRSPIGPGEDLRSIAKNDAACKRIRGCPDARYYNGLQIYTTAQTSFVLDHVNNLPGSREKQQLHEVTVILLDASGHRISESAWYRDFWLPQAGAGA
jgi:hypothetical protein